MLYYIIKYLHFAQGTALDMGLEVGDEQLDEQVLDDELVQELDDELELLVLEDDVVVEQVSYGGQLVLELDDTFV